MIHPSEIQIPPPGRVYRRPNAAEALRITRELRAIREALRLEGYRIEKRDSRPEWRIVGHPEILVYLPSCQEWTLTPPNKELQLIIDRAVETCREVR